MKNLNNLDNLRIQVCQDIIKEYSLTKEDIVLMLRVYDFVANKPYTFYNFDNIEDVDFNAPVIDPDDYNYNIFEHGKIKS